MFGAVSQTTMALVLLVLLIATVKYVNAKSPYPPLAPRLLLAKPEFYSLHFRKEPATHAFSLVHRQHFRDLRPSDIPRLPLTLILLSSLEHAAFGLSAQLVGTAIATAVAATSPIFVVYFLARFNMTDQEYRTGQRVRRHPLTTEHIVLSLVAAVGVLFMLLSQAEDNEATIESLISLRAPLGILLALGAGVLSTCGVVGSFMYGKALYYWHTEEDPTDKQLSQLRVEERGSHDLLLLLWLTILAATIVRLLAIPLQTALVLVSESGTLVLDRRALLGACLIGCAGATNIILVRFANLLAASPGINAVAYITPGLALVILMAAGIELPRLDLFGIGAALILATNVLIQLKPDQERDTEKFGIESRSGTRFGFTVLIISLWTFGTLIYLRDEVYPEHWLEWPIGEYWGLIALSATVFTLILSFRVSRLGDRTKEEDILMLSLFRDAERLEAIGLFGDSGGGFCKKLSDLDRAPAKKLLRAYNAVHADLREARRAELGRMHMESLVSLQKQLDSFAHSKQQGRDIVELIALMSFAFVTIGLGLLARQTPAGSIDAMAWNGFLSDVFVLFFVSTVAFLMMNLFDLRRERETALLVSVPEHDDEYGLFFRNKKKLTVDLVVAICISVVVAGLFVWLLYNKWLVSAGIEEPARLGWFGQSCEARAARGC